MLSDTLPDWLPRFKRRRIWATRLPAVWKISSKRAWRDVTDAERKIRVRETRKILRECRSLSLPSYPFCFIRLRCGRVQRAKIIDENRAAEERLGQTIAATRALQKEVWQRERRKERKREIERNKERERERERKRKFVCVCVCVCV